MPGRWKLATFLPFRLCSLLKAPLSAWQVVKTDPSLFLFEVTYGGWETMPQWTRLKENYFLTSPSTCSKSSRISPGVKKTKPASCAEPRKFFTKEGRLAEGCAALPVSTDRVYKSPVSEVVFTDCGALQSFHKTFTLVAKRQSTKQPDR